MKIKLKIKKKNQCKKCKLKNFISILHSSVFPTSSLHQVPLQVRSANINIVK